jgi:hypothetical protein
MKRWFLVFACIIFWYWPGHEAAAERRDFRGGYHGGYSRGYSYRGAQIYGNARAHGYYSGYYPGYYSGYRYYGGIITSGYATYGNRPAGPYTICTAGRVEDMPVEEQVFWHDGETTYGPKYAGQRCIHQQ